MSYNFYVSAEQLHQTKLNTFPLDFLKVKNVVEDSDIDATNLQQICLYFSQDIVNKIRAVIYMYESLKAWNLTLPELGSCRRELDTLHATYILPISFSAINILVGLIDQIFSSVNKLIYLKNTSDYGYLFEIMNNSKKDTWNTWMQKVEDKKNNIYDKNLYDQINFKFKELKKRDIVNFRGKTFHFDYPLKSVWHQELKYIPEDGLDNCILSKSVCDRNYDKEIELLENNINDVIEFYDLYRDYCKRNII